VITASNNVAFKTAAKPLQMGQRRVHLHSVGYMGTRLRPTFVSNRPTVVPNSNAVFSITGNSCVEGNVNKFYFVWVNIGIFYHLRNHTRPNSMVSYLHKNIH